MNKKTIAIILELIPIISAITSFILIASHYDVTIARHIIKITIILSFIGFIFFLIGRKIIKKDKLVKILGILDLFATLYVILLYLIAFFSFGL